MQNSIKLLLTFALILSTAAIVVAQSGGEPVAETGLTTFTLGKRSPFKISMPGKPTVESSKLKVERDTIQSDLYTSSSSNLVAVVGDVSNLPLIDGGISPALQKQFFNKVREGIVEGVKEEMEKSGVKIKFSTGPERKITHDSFSGFEQDMTIGQLKGRARMLTGDGHIFIFLLIAIDETGQDLMDGVLDSFEYIGNTM